jgi:glutathione S-transferase
MSQPPELPILYSFRRCPYAMRARMALDYSEIQYQHREILLKDKPAAMLEASAKGTVPVVVLASGEVLDESRDVMMWALRQCDRQQWYVALSTEQQHEIDRWIDRNDNHFKPWLDKYKYSVGYPEHPAEYYRQQAEGFLAELNQTLESQPFLLGERESLADNALFPFVRQFAYVDKVWFDASQYTNLQQWLEGFLGGERFARVMEKHVLWRSGEMAR